MRRRDTGLGVGICRGGSKNNNETCCIRDKERMGL